MLQLLREEFDKILIGLVLAASMTLYYVKPGEITAGWVGTVIGVLATLLTQKVSQAVSAARSDPENGDGKHPGVKP